MFPRLLECYLAALNRGEKVPKRIMIVDEGPEVRQVIRAVFEARTDYEICGEASNGAEAIEKALELKPDLLLLDVAMPMLNGVEVASVLAGSLPQMPSCFTLCTTKCWAYPWLPRWGLKRSSPKRAELLAA